jgi:hypothetical protein
VQRAVSAYRGSVAGLSRRAIDQREQAQLSAHFASVSDVLGADKVVRNVLEMGRHLGSNAWLYATQHTLSAHEFATGLQLRLCAPPREQRMACHGCGVSLPARDHQYHVPGCLRVHGANATYVHDRVKRALARTCQEAAVDSELEPRDLMIDVDGVAKRPDLRIWMSGRVQNNVLTPSVAVDVTAVNAAAPSCAHRAVSALVRERTLKKRARYAALVENSVYPNGAPKTPEELLVFHFFVTGGLSGAACSVLRRLVRAAEEVDDLDFDVVLADISVSIVRGVARVLGARECGIGADA